MILELDLEAKEWLILLKFLEQQKEKISDGPESEIPPLWNRTAGVILKFIESILDEMGVE